MPVFNAITYLFYARVVPFADMGSLLLASASGPRLYNKLLTTDTVMLKDRQLTRLMLTTLQLLRLPEIRCKFASFLFFFHF